VGEPNILEGRLVQGTIKNCFWRERIYVTRRRMAHASFGQCVGIFNLGKPRDFVAKFDAVDCCDIETINRKWEELP
jgi:hypothetical protein